jgi:hypothetical protein
LKNFACLAFIPEQLVIEEFEKLEEETPESLNGLYQIYFILETVIMFYCIHRIY